METQQQVKELFESYNEYLARLVPGTLAIAELLHKEDISNALSQIVDFSNGIDWLVEATELLKMSAQVVELDINKVVGFLEIVNEGLEKKDYVLVADILEFEISEYFKKLSRIEE